MTLADRRTLAFRRHVGMAADLGAFSGPLA
jgi:hypothetical protein